MTEPWIVDRPSAYDMPIGTIVTTRDAAWIRAYDAPGGWHLILTAGIQSGWIEGLFSDGLAAVLRLGTGE